MNNILIALNPSKDKSGEILSKVVSQVKNVFNSATLYLCPLGINLLFTEFLL